MSEGAQRDEAASDKDGQSVSCDGKSFHWMGVFVGASCGQVCTLACAGAVCVCMCVCVCVCVCVRAPDHHPGYKNQRLLYVRCSEATKGVVFAQDSGAEKRPGAAGAGPPAARRSLSPGSKQVPRRRGAPSPWESGQVPWQCGAPSPWESGRVPWHLSSGEQAGPLAARCSLSQGK